MEKLCQGIQSIRSFHTINILLISIFLCARLARRLMTPHLYLQAYLGSGIQVMIFFVLFWTFQKKKNLNEHVLLLPWKKF